MDITNGDSTLTSRQTKIRRRIKHHSLSHAKSLDTSKSFTVKMEEDVNCPSTPRQKQNLFTEKRKEKVEKHAAFSHPFTLAVFQFMNVESKVHLLTFGLHVKYNDVL